MIYIYRKLGIEEHRCRHPRRQEARHVSCAVALRVADLDESVAFYSILFNSTPAKRRPGYANFAAEPPLKLVLLEGLPGEETRMDHLGVGVETTALVDEAHRRLADGGLTTRPENETTCCDAVQDKVWVTGAGREPWEVYTVTADARTDLEGLTTLQTPDPGDSCCAPSSSASTDGTNLTPPAHLPRGAPGCAE